MLRQADASCFQKMASYGNFSPPAAFPEPARTSLRISKRKQNRIQLRRLPRALPDQQWPRPLQYPLGNHRRRRLRKLKTVICNLSSVICNLKEDHALH
jgi:hypothetical protein